MKNMKVYLIAVMALTQIQGVQAQAVKLNYDRDIEQVDVFSNAVTSTVNNDSIDTWSTTLEGQITNTLNNGISKVSIVYDGKEYFSNYRGEFSIKRTSSTGKIIVKKPGYRKLVVQPQRGNIYLQLEPIDVKSLYMPAGILRQGMKSATYAKAMKLIESTEINALTIDFKDDEGRVGKEIKPHIDILKQKNIYTIARIVAFKDNVMPRKNKGLALINVSTGEPWQDKNKVTYLNAFSPAAWDYLINVSKEAVAAGFDEIQYDYVRFPTDGNRSLVKDLLGSDAKSRSAAIGGFLKKARAELGAMGAFVAADVFGDTAFVPGDSGIGQQIEAIAPHLDFICPMVYPSGYNKNYASVKDPVNQPGDIVEVSVKRYRIRAEASNDEVIIRPWLQAFRDYSPARKEYGEKEIRAQIDASDSAGGHGWLLWNAAGNYSTLGLKIRKALRIH